MKPSEGTLVVLCKKKDELCLKAMLKKFAIVQRARTPSQKKKDYLDLLGFERGCLGACRFTLA